VVVRRNATRGTKKPGQRKPPPPVEAFFTTELTLSTEDILSEYSDRWAVEIDIRDTNAFDGLGQDQGRKRQRIIGANTFRLIMAAARTLWFLDQVERGAGVNLGRYRPWYRQKCAPSQLDVVWACREVLHEAGMFHIPPDYVVRCVVTHRKPPEVRIWRLSIQSDVGTRPPSTSTPHCPAWMARHW
jgi:hypothetical protein